MGSEPAVHQRIAGAEYRGCWAPGLDSLGFLAKSSHATTDWARAGRTNLLSPLSQGKQDADKFGLTVCAGLIECVLHMSTNGRQ